MKHKIKVIISYVALFAWMILIFSFSNQSGGESGSTSNGVIEGVMSGLDFLFKFGFTEEDIMNVISACGLWIRKCAHFTEYFILGLLMTNALRFTIKNTEKLQKKKTAHVTI